MVYLIQHKYNGYVHCVFDTIIAAHAWINRYPGSEYTIIEREVFNNIHDIGR